MTRPQLPLLLAALALVLLALTLVRDHTRDDSLSADEPIHILSGYLQVAAGTAIVNMEHPPLMKALSGLALQALPLERPPERIPMGGRFGGYAQAFLFGNRVSPEEIVAAARSPFLLLFAALLLLVFFAASARYGGAAGLFGAALLAFDPNLIAHAGVVHTDLGAALTFPSTVLAWESARKRPSPSRLLLASLCLGLALATKFSAVYLLPILLLQTLLSAKEGSDTTRAVGQSLLRLGAVAVGALLLLFVIYAVVNLRISVPDQKAVIREMVAQKGGAPDLAEAIAAVSEFSPPIAHYFGGLASVVRQNTVGGGVTYLAGRVSTEGFPHYFLVAFLAKSTLAFLAVTALSLIAMGRRWGWLREEARLFLLPVGVLFLASFGTTYNIGIRHLLPVYPFLALAGSALFGWAFRKSQGRGARALLLASLPLLSAFEVFRIHPHELSYFNPLVGGPEAGRQILSDSNVDWGLDLKRLASELERRGISDPTVAYFGGDNVSYRLGVPDFSSDPRVRGRFVAISSFYLAAGPDFYLYHGWHGVAKALESLRRDLAVRWRPAGRVGYSIYLYELPMGEHLP